MHQFSIKSEGFENSRNMHRFIYFWYSEPPLSVVFGGGGDEW
jgi:hypothetical protein